MTCIDRLTLLVSAMLTGISSPGDAHVERCILIARAAMRKIEAAALEDFKC